MAKNENRASTCICALRLTPLGGVFVSDGCKNPKVLYIPLTKGVGIEKVTIKRPYILGKYCDACKYYVKRTRKNAKSKKETEKQETNKTKPTKAKSSRKASTTKPKSKDKR